MTAAIDLKASKATEKHTARHNNVGDVLATRARAAVFVSKLQRAPRNKLTVLALLVACCVPARGLGAFYFHQVCCAAYTEGYSCCDYYQVTFLDVALFQCDSYGAGDKLIGVVHFINKTRKNAP